MGVVGWLGVMMDGIDWGFAIGHALFVGVAVFWLLLFWSLNKQMFLVEMAGLIYSISCFIFLIGDESERYVAPFSCDDNFNLFCFGFSLCRHHEVALCAVQVCCGVVVCNGDSRCVSLSELRGFVWFIDKHTHVY